MSLKIWSIAKYLGLAPINLENRTKNVVQLSFAILLNQIRNIFCLYLYIRDMCSGKAKPFYTAVECLTVLVHNGLVSIWIYTAFTKLETWAKLFKIINLLQDENIFNSVCCVLCYTGYFFVIAAETFLFALNKPFWTSETIFIWINFHLSQCINYFIVVLLQQMIVSLTKSYKIFEEEFQQQFHVRLVGSTGNEIRRKYLTKIRKYQILYDLHKEFNEVFGMSLLSSLGSIFANIICGITVFSLTFSETEYSLHVGTFLTQVIISLVSLFELLFNNKYMYPFPIFFLLI